MGEQRQDIWRITACVMHMGTMKFKQRGREEQAEADGTLVSGQRTTISNLRFSFFVCFFPYVHRRRPCPWIGTGFIHIFEICPTPLYTKH